MIAALGMYDRPETAPAHDRLWALIRDGLRDRGVAAPEALTRGEGAYWPAWEAPDLVLAQTCGLPYRARLHGRVTLVGTPDYGLPGCPAGHYHSVFIARADDPRPGLADFAEARLAFNEALSQSGWAAPMEHAARTGLRFGSLVQTGGHRLSMLAVAEGRADTAALDAVTWRMLRRWEPAAAGLRVLAETRPTPGLPLIAAPGADADASFAAVARAIAALDPADRDLLGLVGLVRIPPESYLALPIPAAPAQMGQAD